MGPYSLKLLSKGDNQMIWNNVKTFHHRLMMRYLRRRGWVVFYLDPEHRTCNHVCWLSLYNNKGQCGMITNIEE